MSEAAQSITERPQLRRPELSSTTQRIAIIVAVSTSGQSVGEKLL